MSILFFSASMGEISSVSLLGIIIFNLQKLNSVNERAGRHFQIMDCKTTGQKQKKLDRRNNC